MGVKGDDWGNAVGVVVNVDDIFGIRIDVLGLGAHEQALHLLADFAELLQLVRGVQLLLVLSIARIGRDLKQLGGRDTAQEATIVELGAGDDVPRSGVKRFGLRHHICGL